MKKCLLLFLLFSVSSIAQSLSDYKYVMVPVKFEFLKENQFRMNTLTKHKLSNMGFTAFYDNESLPVELASNRCEMLNVNVEKEKAFMTLKLFVTFTDCQNKLIFKSEIGATKEKDFNKAYQEALEKAFQSIYAQNYKYNGTTHGSVITQPIAQTTTNTAAAAPKVTGKLKAEAISNGYLLIDEESSKIVLRITKTSDPKTYLATNQGKQGVLIQKENGWFFEYSQDDKLVSEKIDVNL